MSPLPAFPTRDPVGPDVAPGVDVEVLAHLLVPLAADADHRGVTRESMDRLAAVGYLGEPLTPPARQRELAEVVAGIDATTWFCWVQHQTPLRTLDQAVPSPDAPDAAALQSQLLPGLRAGTTLAGVAFAHVRRPGPPNPTATRVAGGWRVNGTLDWITSWDIADVFLLVVEGAGPDAGRLVQAYLPAGRGEPLPGLVPDLPLALLAMGGTHTRPIVLSDVFVPNSLVASVVDKDEWLSADAIHSCNANPSAFGVTRGAIAELDALAAQRSDDGLVSLAAALTQECRAIRRAAYAGIDDGHASVDDCLRWRAASLDLVVRAATAVVVARAGAAMRTRQDAERRVREAMFLQVQAQTGATRSASVELLLRASQEATRRVSD
jgi:alkylation response protein AidB-like acyl-CoA dehydrogenase